VCSPEDRCEEDDQRQAEDHGVGWTDSIAAGEPGQAVDDSGKCLRGPGMLLLSILIVTVVLVLELLQVSEVLYQGEID